MNMKSFDVYLTIGVNVEINDDSINVDDDWDKIAEIAVRKIRSSAKDVYIVDENVTEIEEYNGK